MSTPLTRASRWLPALTLSLALGVDVDAQTLVSPGLQGGGRGATAQPGARFEAPQDEVVLEPTTNTQYPCYYWGYYLWDDLSGSGPVQARVAWPNNCSQNQGPAGEFPFPLVVLMHGDGQSYDDFQYLLNHLGRNGFIVASVDVGQFTTNSERAARARVIMNFLQDSWEYKAWVDPTEVALIGFGRSGEAAVQAARSFSFFGPWTHDGFQIDSVVSIASTDVGELGSYEDLSGLHARNYLVIAGSKDDTVLGYCTDGLIPGCGGVPGDVQRTGFGLFDRAGLETSASLVNPSHVRKAMLFVDGADHHRWKGTASCGFGAPGVISCDAHHDIAKGYLNAWLRWTVRDQDQFEPFFTGEWMPPQVGTHDVNIRQQYSAGNQRRMLDNFDDGVLASGDFGSVQVDPQLQVLNVDEVWDHPDYSAPHDTRALIARWSQQPWSVDPSIRWNIDPFELAPGVWSRDVSEYEVFSFRMGLMHGSSDNDGSDLSVWVRLEDADGHVSNWQDSALFTTIREPEAGAVNQTVTFLPGYVPKSTMQTVRIPLDGFHTVDMQDISAVTIRFAERDSGEVMLDTVEFSR